MTNPNLLDFKKNEYSQNGEDGIINEIFRRIGIETKACCEFGAWDGIHLSNCRKLILSGWSALMIEGNKQRFDSLVSNYSDRPDVICVNKFVDAGKNSLAGICTDNGLSALDFLSVDIDGLDYEIFESLDFLPRVICIEVNAGHNPANRSRVQRSVAMNNVGQSLQVFTDIADSKGYDLVCYNGNAFYVRRDANKGAIASMKAEEAYTGFISQLSANEKEWLYLVNIGAVAPYYSYSNLFLNREALRISHSRALHLRVLGYARFLARKLKSVVN